MRVRSLRGASALAGSALAAQVITLVVTPILSRIYPPAAFGSLTVVVAAASILTPMVALRLESALMLPPRREQATALLVLGLLSAAAISLVTAVSLEVLAAIGAVRDVAEVPGLGWWVGLVAFASGTFVLLGQFALREHRYRAVGQRSVVQSAVTAGLQLALATVSAGPLGLIGGHATGRLAGTLPLLKALRSDLAPFDARELRTALVAYRMFPLVFAPAALLNATALALPVICAAVWFGVDDAGQWGMAERVLALPLVIVVAAIGQVVEAELAQWERERGIGAVTYYMRMTLALCGISLLVSGVVLLAAAPVVSFVLGQQWHEAAVIMHLLVPMLATRIVAAPMSKALVVARWASVNFWLDAGRALIVAATLFVCWATGATLHQLVFVTSVVFAAVYVATWCAGLAAARRIGTPLPRT